MLDGITYAAAAQEREQAKRLFAELNETDTDALDGASYAAWAALHHDTFEYIMQLNDFLRGWQ